MLTTPPTYCNLPKVEQAVLASFPESLHLLYVECFRRHMVGQEALFRQAEELRKSMGLAPHPIVLNNLCVEFNPSPRIFEVFDPDSRGVTPAQNPPYMPACRTFTEPGDSAYPQEGCSYLTAPAWTAGTLAPVIGEAAVWSLLKQLGLRLQAPYSPLTWQVLRHSPLDEGRGRIARYKDALAEALDL